MPKKMLTAMTLFLLAIGISASCHASSLSVKWSLNGTEDAPISNAFIDNDNYIVVTNSSVTAYNFNGERKWKYNSTKSIQSSFNSSVHNSTLVIDRGVTSVLYDTELTTLIDLSNGTVISDFSHTGKNVASVVLPNKIITILQKTYQHSEFTVFSFNGSVLSNSTFLNGNYAYGQNIIPDNSQPYLYSIRNYYNGAYSSNTSKHDIYGHTIWSHNNTGSAVKICQSELGDIFVAHNPTPWSPDSYSIFSYDSGGTLNWEYKNYVTGVMDMQVGEDGTLYVLSAKSNYYLSSNNAIITAIDRLSGTQKWEYSISPTGTSSTSRLKNVGEMLYITINERGAYLGAPTYSYDYNSNIVGITTSGLWQWNKTQTDWRAVGFDESSDGILFFAGDRYKLYSLLEASVPPRAYIDGDIAPYGATDARLTASDALVALQCAIGKLTTSPSVSYDGDVAPLDNSTGVLQPNPDGQVNIGDAVVLLKGSVGQYAWEGMALLNGQRYMANIVTDTPDVSNAFGYQFDILIGNGGYNPTDPGIGLVNATGSLPSGSTLDGNYDDSSRTMSFGLVSTQALNNSLPEATNLGTGRYLLLKFPIPETVVADSLSKIAIINDGDPANGFVDNLGAKITSPPIGRMFYLTNENY